jgi:hypothetical protein
VSEFLHILQLPRVNRRLFQALFLVVLKHAFPESRASDAHNFVLHGHVRRSSCSAFRPSHRVSV